ncbi:MAG: hypothetical protein JRJ15_11080 [Deltaproteobacteria bacterium]|nr:hypothetical protein [Deltaproteobacteria bacterium]
MKVHFLFSSPNGDLSLGPEDLARPFLITPSEPHPFLTLGDYFESLKAFILKDRAKRAVSVLNERIEKEIGLDDIHKILIRSEKHGVLYHLASVEVFVEAQRIMLTVSTAVSEKGKRWLAREYEILNYLNSGLNLPYLPKVYSKRDVECQAGNGKNETLAMLLSEWFEDYHEWHLSNDETGNSQRVCIWDLKNGNRYASKKETFEIFRQASKILTLYYDMDNFNQIYPWHHAAGDFIVRTRSNGLDVKLTTARKYQTIMDVFSDDIVDPMVAMIYFFLNLTIKMRLDKLDGVGMTVWAGDFSVDAATVGFFEALQIMEAQGRYSLGQVEDLLFLLTSFNEDELGRLFHPLFGLYERDDPADLSVIQADFKSHVSLLFQTLRKFRL